LLGIAEKLVSEPTVHSNPFERLEAAASKFLDAVSSFGDSSSSCHMNRVRSETRKQSLFSEIFKGSLQEFLKVASGESISESFRSNLADQKLSLSPNSILLNIIPSQLRNAINDFIMVADVDTTLRKDIPYYLGSFISTMSSGINFLRTAGSSSNTVDIEMISKALYQEMGSNKSNCQAVFELVKLYAICSNENRAIFDRDAVAFLNELFLHKIGTGTEKNNELFAIIAIKLREEAAKTGDEFSTIVNLFSDNITRAELQTHLDGGKAVYCDLKENSRHVWVMPSAASKDELLIGSLYTLKDIIPISTDVSTFSGRATEIFQNMGFILEEASIKGHFRLMNVSTPSYFQSLINQEGLNIPIFFNLASERQFSDTKALEQAIKSPSNAVYCLVTEGVPAVVIDIHTAYLRDLDAHDILIMVARTLADIRACTIETFDLKNFSSAFLLGHQ
jgi:hypothetical protein